MLRIHGRTIRIGNNIGINVIGKFIFPANRQNLYENEIKLEHATETVREKPEEPTRYYQPSISLSRILAYRRNQQGRNFQSG
jgi:hypothetical protein